MAKKPSRSHQGDLFSETSGGGKYKRSQRFRRSQGDGFGSADFGEQLSLELSPGIGRRIIGTRGRLSIASISMQRVRLYLPSRAEPYIMRLLREVPTEIVPVRTRESMHGDFTQEPGCPYGRITVNVCGNRYRFLLTLLHELAHARVATRYRRYVKPHGKEWKEEFSRLLFRLMRYDVLPARLRKTVYQHALAPKSTDEYDADLQLALRRYDTADQRLMVMELEEGTKFSLDGKSVLRRGKLVRRRIRCTAANGQVYSVLPAARVEMVFDR